MYAKLVVGGTDANLYQCIRDICRLLTSSSPSISNLSGNGFSTSTSVIIDNTPAGWTYVGSTKATDQAGIGAGSADATFSTTVYNNWIVSAPTAFDATQLKYCVLTQALLANTGVYPFCFSLTMCQTATSAGVVTNESYRNYNSTAITAVGQNNLQTIATTTLHLIATPRHITIIREGFGMHAVWEASSTDVNIFYNRPTVCAYYHGNSSSYTVATQATPTAGNVNTVGATVLNVTDVNTATNYGVFAIPAANNGGSFIQQIAGARANAVDASGNPKYQATPVYFHNGTIGHPTQYVTGVVPIYWCKAGLGNTGDTVSINGDLYTYFNCGASGAGYSVLMKTS